MIFKILNIMNLLSKFNRTVYQLFMVLTVALCLFSIAVRGADVASENETGKAKAEKIHGKIYDKVEQMPEFPGGQTELINFLMKSVKYPKECMEKGIQGKVFVSFAIGKKGKIANAAVVRGVDPLLDAEAIRVVNSMPPWEPGKEKGKKVAVQFTLPISFRLQ
jgi:protein TonB